MIEVEAQGVGPIKLNMPDSLAFFVMPENLEQLEKQINELYKDDQASAQRRINKAKMDMELAPLFNNIVSNEDAKKAAAQIKEVILNELKKRK